MRNFITQQLFGLFFLFGTITGLFAQNGLEKKVDSLLLLVPSSGYEEQKEAFWVVNNFIARNAQGKEIELLEYALTKDNSDVAQMVVHMRLGNYYSRQGDTEKALEIKLMGLALAEKLNDEREIVYYFISVGNSYLYLNKTDEALDYLNRAETLAVKDEYKDLLWNVYYHKALLQNSLGDTEGNVFYNEKMWGAVEDYPNTSTKRFVLYQLIDIYSQMDYPERLAKYTEILADLYEDANPNMPEGHMPIKSIFQKRADPENIPQLKKSIRISDSLNSLNTLVYSSITLADTYVEMGEPTTGIVYLERAAEKLKKKKKPQILMDVYTKLSSTSAHAKDYQNAYIYKQEESRIRDSVTSQRMLRNIAELEVKFDTEKKEKEIAEQQLIIQTESKKKNQILISAIGLGLLLLLSILFFRKRLKDQKTIAQQQESIRNQEIIELQQKNKLLALNSMIEGQEAERLRIAQDLHDSLGGLLSTVKAHFTTIQNEIKQLEQLNIAGTTNQLIDEACLEVRRISHNMMPHALSISGLEGTLEDMSENLKKQGYNVSLEMTQVPKLETTKEVMVYRLVQELIANINKHANAKSILIQLLGLKNELTLIVEDDGQGFNYQEAIEQGGLGLKSIESRVEYLDGTIDWDSVKNEGTTITINIPL